MEKKDKIILIKGEISTSQISSIEDAGENWKIIYNNISKPYCYSKNNVELLDKCEILDINNYQIYKDGKIISNIKEILKFKNKDGKEFFKIIFNGEKIKEYYDKDLYIKKSGLIGNDSKEVFDYLKELSSISDIKNDETGEKILEKFFNSLSFVPEDVALSKYLNPSSLNNTINSCENYVPIFPFGCNNSQYTAVKTAMENQISVIQGPPGTGKTQTILNIIANILKDNKNVIVVSNNNSATENVYQKLASDDYNLGFIVAKLGNFINKNNFINQQENIKYPEFENWKIDEDPNKYLEAIEKQSIHLRQMFDKQERLALLKQELSCLTTEKAHFSDFVEKFGVNFFDFKLGDKITSQKIISLWHEIQLLSEKSKPIGFWFKLKSFFKYGIKDQKIYENEDFILIIILQYNFFKVKEEELLTEINKISDELNSEKNNILKEFCGNSMKILKDTLARKYSNKDITKFEYNDLKTKSYDVLDQYPVILSTTFSARNNLHSSVIYDYLIMDEASQVDIVTGALALSCAKNVVIVGDTKQLPNVVTDGALKESADIFEKFKNLNAGYSYKKSFLQSILDIMPNVKNTLLKEHYRCHPKIINFCNQKFYDGELVIMTKDNNEKDVLSIIKTVPGNHVRDKYSQRQIDVIKEEVFAKFNLNPDDTGIIAPYRNQANELKSQIDDVNSDTVHKFQGQEKENIIISTVDDYITEFADNPYLINVAVSRAKSKLIVVVSGNEQIKDSNIMDLVGYVKYNNFEIIQSKVNSVFDYLYKQYDEVRYKNLTTKNLISKYTSENSAYSLINKILNQDYRDLGFKFSYPLRLLVRNTSILDEMEKRYIESDNTHDMYPIS